MISNASICVMLNQPDVQCAPAQHSNAVIRVEEEKEDDDPVLSGLNCAYKRHGDNLTLGELDFTYVPSQMISSREKHSPTVGDLCVRLTPLIARDQEFVSIVDLYNTYCVKGSAQMATRCINSYLGDTGALYVPAIPITLFVSEWNRTLTQFHNIIKCTDESSGVARTPKQVRASVMATVANMALENVPTQSEHLWFILHCLVSKPSLVREVVQLVGSVASCTGSSYHTGEVNDVKVPKDIQSRSQRLYLIAKSKSTNNNTLLGDESGVPLGLMWVNCEEELFDYLRNAGNSRYVHLGTEAGGIFRCTGFSEWRRYDSVLFDRMSEIGTHLVKRVTRTHTKLAGDTADSARAITRML